MLDQIEDGAGHASLLLQRLDQRQEEHLALSAELEGISDAQEPFAMPDLPAAYDALVRSLENTLRDTNVVQRAHEALASMIEAVILRPDPEAQDGYSITLRGDCAGILGAYGGFQKEKLPEAVGLVGSQFSVVAGVGFEPTTFRL